MLYWVGITISFFLSLLLLSKKNKQEADKILALWLFLIGIHLFTFYARINQLYTVFPYLLGFDLPFPLIHGPFLYLYVGSLTVQKVKYKLLHFTPVLLMYAVLLPFLTLPVEDKIFVYQHEGVGYETQSNLLYVLIVISGITYIILSLLLLKKHKKNIADQFSYSEKINLDWLRNLVFGIILIWVMVLLRNDHLIFSVVTAFVIYIGYFGINQVGIFSQKDQQLKPVDEPPLPAEEPVAGKDDFTETATDNAKYQKSGLSEESAKDIHGKLQQLMQQQKPYLDPELTLQGLAKQLDVHPNILSQVINSKEKKNFYDYVNSYRVEQFKSIALLPENQKFSILALAFECGFNSKTSFNRNFKKVTSLSPSDYLKMQDPSTSSIDL